MAVYTYRVLVTCDRNDIGSVPRRFIEGDMIEVPDKIDSPKFELISSKGEAPPKKEKIDPQLAAINKKRADTVKNTG